MTTTEIETVPTAWTTDDERFFRVTQGLFEPNFLSGAGVLLASYDVDETRPHQVAPALTVPTARTAKSQVGVA